MLIRAAVFLSFLIGGIPQLWAKPAPEGSLYVTVKDTRGHMLDDAIVFLKNRDGKTAHVPRSRKLYIMAHKEFVPHVLAVRKGSVVSFPNLDKVKHNVYSISVALQFDIPLYARSKSSSPKERFNHEGPVVVGCKIHDWMSGFIYVVDTPYFVKTVGGEGEIKGLPFGQYDAYVWHPNQNQQEPQKKTVTVSQAYQKLGFEVFFRKNRRWIFNVKNK